MRYVGKFRSRLGITCLAAAFGLAAAASGGFGESQPIASNATPQEGARNCRVVITLSPLTS
jgi:hypothetical protein